MADVLEFPKANSLDGFSTGAQGRSFEHDAGIAAAKLRDAVDALVRARRSLAEAGDADRHRGRAVTDHMGFTGRAIESLVRAIEAELEGEGATAPARPEGPTAREKAIISGHPSALGPA